MLPSPESADPPPGKTDFRIVAAVFLLAAAIVFTWLTIDGLSSRRKLRTELAEISHVRYGLLSADRWVEKIAPILEAKIDALDLKAEARSNLRPAVENALYRLLADVKEKASAKDSQGAGGLLGQGNALMANLLVGALRPHVPEYADVVLAELGKPETKDTVKKYMKNVLADGAKNTFGNLDMRLYGYILKEHGCADAGACQKELGTRTAGLDAKVAYDYLAVLASSALAFLLLTTGRPVLRRSGTAVLLMFCVVLLAGGVLTPMVEVEATISRLGMTFLGEPVAFTDQLLYFQSKSVLEVFRTLINVGRPDMWFVGVLVLTFSVIFPVLKIFTLAFCLYRPAVLRENRVARFLGLESSKWSMADVMALAIFMSYVAFNGVISTALGGLQSPGAQIVIPLDSSQILAGFYLFLGFVLASLFLAAKLEHDLRSAAA